jgi:hypothetical protein
VARESFASSLKTAVFHAGFRLKSSVGEEMSGKYLGKDRAVLLIFGWGPLWTIALLATIGLCPDPNPNPIGLGLLFFFTFWPALISLAIGVFQVRRRRAYVADALERCITMIWRVSGAAVLTSGLEFFSIGG